MITRASKQKGGTSKMRVLIVDSQPLVCDWLMRVLKEQNDFTCSAVARDRQTAVEAVAENQPDMVITGLCFDHSSVGIEIIKDIKVLAPGLPVLVLSLYDENLFAERVLHAGATGYVDKHATPQTILNAIRTVARGEIYVSEKMAATALKSFASSNPIAHTEIEQLSDRELEIFELLGHGRSAHQIAEQLKISFKTVETYKWRLKEKLDIATAPELLQRAVEWVIAEAAA